MSQSSSENIPASTVTENREDDDDKTVQSDPPPPSYDSVCRISLTSYRSSSVPSNSQLPKYGDIAVLDPPPTYHSMFSDPLGDMIRTFGPLAERGYNASRGIGEENADIEVQGGMFPWIKHKYRFIFICMLLLIITVTMSVVLPLIMIIVGIVYVNQCPVQPRIPIYLIVLGFFQMTECCGRLACRCLYDNNSNSQDSCRARYQRKDPLFYFLVVWFVIGSMWVYQTDPDCKNCTRSHQPKGFIKLSANNGTETALNVNHDRSSLYCDNFVYTFAFWTVTTYYSLLAIFSFFILADLLLRVVGRCCRRE